MKEKSFLKIRKATTCPYRENKEGTDLITEVKLLRLRSIDNRLPGNINR